MYIPDECLALNNMTISPKTGKGKVIKIKALEKGYYPTIMVLTQEEVDERNSEMGVDKITAKSMYEASMFGWDCYNDIRKSYEKVECGNPHSRHLPKLSKERVDLG